MFLIHFSDHFFKHVEKQPIKQNKPPTFDFRQITYELRQPALEHSWVAFISSLSPYNIHKQYSSHTPHA